MRAKSFKIRYDNKYLFPGTFPTVINSYFLELNFLSGHPKKQFYELKLLYLCFSSISSIFPGIFSKLLDIFHDLIKDFLKLFCF